MLEKFEYLLVIISTRSLSSIRHPIILRIFRAPTVNNRSRVSY